MFQYTKYSKSLTFTGAFYQIHRYTVEDALCQITNEYDLWTSPRMKFIPKLGSYCIDELVYLISIILIIYHVFLFSVF